MNILFIIAFAGYSLHPYALYDEYDVDGIYVQKTMSDNKYLSGIDLDLYKSELVGCSLELIMNKDYGNTYNVSTRTDGPFTPRVFEKIPMRFNGTTAYAQRYEPDECRTVMNSMFLMSQYDQNMNILAFHVEMTDPTCNLVDLAKSNETIRIYPGRWSSDIAPFSPKKRVMLPACHSYNFPEGTSFHEYAYSGIPEIEPILAMNTIHEFPEPVGISKMRASHAFSDSRATILVDQLCGSTLNITLEGARSVEVPSFSGKLAATITRLRIRIEKPFPDHATIKLYGKQAMMYVTITSTNGISDIQHLWTAGDFKSEIQRQGKDEDGLIATEAILYVGGYPILFCNV